MLTTSERSKEHTSSPPSQVLVEQNHSAYSEQDHRVWSLLFRRRMDELKTTASLLFVEGSRIIGLRPDAVPDLNEVNRRLGAITGWQAVGVRGFLEAREFFRSLAARRFPTTVTLRSMDQLEYLPEPDIFHDIFGHVPLHADPVFADFLQTFGATAARARKVSEVEAMARLFWFTVEFGLVREGGNVKIYGSGLISSGKDAANALGPSCERRPFSLDAVLAQPFQIDRVQDVLFVVDSFGELFEAVAQARTRLERGSL